MVHQDGNYLYPGQYNQYNLLSITDWMILPSGQDPVHSWKAGPGEVMTMENVLFIYL